MARARYNAFFYTELDKRSLKFLKKYGKELRSYVLLENVDELMKTTGEVPARYKSIRKMGLPVFQYYNPEEDSLQYYEGKSAYNFGINFVQEISQQPDDSGDEPEPARLTPHGISDPRLQPPSTENPFAEPWKTEEVGGSRKLTKEEMDRLSSNPTSNPAPEDEPPARMAPRARTAGVRLKQ